MHRPTIDTPPRIQSNIGARVQGQGRCGDYFLRQKDVHLVSAVANKWSLSVCWPPKKGILIVKTGILRPELPRPGTPPAIVPGIGAIASRPISWRRLLAQREHVGVYLILASTHNRYIQMSSLLVAESQKNCTREMSNEIAASIPATYTARLARHLYGQESRSDGRIVLRVRKRKTATAALRHLLRASRLVAYHERLSG